MCMFTESNMYVWVWSMVSGCDVRTTSAPWLEDSAPAFFLRLALLIAGAEGGWPNRCRHANSDWSRKRTATRICMYVRIYISRYVCIKASKIIIKCIMSFIYVCMYVCTRVSGPVWRAASTWSALRTTRSASPSGSCLRALRTARHIHTYINLRCWTQKGLLHGWKWY